MISAALIVLSLATHFAQSTPQILAEAGPLTNAIPSPPQTPFSPPSTEPSFLYMGYYPDWVSFPPESIEFSYFDWIDFAFAVPDETFTLNIESPDKLRRLVTAAHAYGSKVKLSIGGWSGSKYFSPAVATDASRQTFAQNIAAVYQQYNLDGIDLDWEYPGRIGDTGNLYQGSDSDHLLTFLQILRSLLPSTAHITMAVPPTTFVDDRQQPMTSVSSFAELLDWVLVMVYDTWAGSSRPGPNAPLYDGCGNSTQKDASAAAAFTSWTAAGFPANKLVLGLPAYGYIYSSEEKHLQTRTHPRQFRRSAHLLKSDDGGNTGEISYNNLVQQKAFDASSSCEKLRDGCSATPYLRCPGQVVSYDDPESIAMKAKFAKALGLKGLNFWTATGDTSDWVLTRAAHNA